MEKIDQIKELATLAQIKADILKSRLAKARNAERLIRQSIEALNDRPRFQPESCEEGRALHRAEHWASRKRRELMAELALQRARSQPLKEETSRAMAREAVLEHLSKRHR